MENEALIPYVGVITEIRQETPDVKTFRVVSKEGEKLFEHIPGQCAMLSIPGVSEAMISITSSPTVKDYMEFSVKKCGCLTTWLHAAEVGQQVTVRGPYGNGFPVDTDFKGKDLVFIAGGIGLAPLHSVINYCRDNAKNYGTLQVIYGARSKQDLVDFKEIIEEWENDPKVEVCLTIDNPQDDWDGHVGFVPSFLKELGFEEGRSARNKKFIIHSMLKYTVDSDFPRITPASFAGGVMPAGITKITYTVDLSGMTPESMM